MGWVQAAEDRVIELVEWINEMVSGGVQKEVAIKMAKDSTGIGKSYWESVLEQVQ